jgi:hypothetical protein
MNTIKAEGLLRLKLNGIMGPFRMYGLQDHIPATIDQIIIAAKEFHSNMSQNDQSANMEKVSNR